MGALMLISNLSEPTLMIHHLNKRHMVKPLITINNLFTRLEFMPERAEHEYLEY